MTQVTRTAIRFSANPERVIARYLTLHGPHRVLHICERIARFSEAEVDTMLADARRQFGERHRHLDAAFERNYQRAVETLAQPPTDFSANRRLLLGACLTMEYSTQSAALFNPSIVPHPDQSGLEPGTLRFIMSLRATGEGHISSIEFRTGTVNQAGLIHLDEADRYATSSEKDWRKTYTRAFVRHRLAYFPHTDEGLLEQLPDEFDLQQATRLLNELTATSPVDPAVQTTRKAILTMLDTNYDVVTDADAPLHERLIFPNAKGESKGMEDVRFVKFRDDDGAERYYSSYTAYDGETIKTQLMETTDFVRFSVRTLYGDAVQDKGMALFPEKINGQYAMISRQGGEYINIMFSDDLYVWNHVQTLLEPVFPWEVVQLGNCGSPLKTDQGWLLLTHGVGPVRRYVISAVLLDLNDPTRVLARLPEPLIYPLESEREGYVPNVVYTCGWLDHGDLIIIPYAMSDSACGIITVSKQELLHDLLTAPAL
ncbi:glycoside hydrolase family 130 protein [Spirosoma sordidisoli]|uniref:Glycosidase n=1 Tax=Spirosoma sordidisoli TaxID=2502893 RepID=A0A4Q2UQL7_9BACT|nr:glycoside hydrolase family 130 protein [Spirosoma sordidisoli]RYC69965.1 glycosidase [Spirosoma sordidisoli]